LFIIFRFISDVFYKKYKEKTFGIKGILGSILLSILLLGADGDYLIPQIKTIRRTADITVIALGEKNEKSASSEVWLLHITNNDTAYDLNNIVIDSGWTRKDGAIYSYQHQPDSIHVKIENPHHASLKFLRHDWSGLAKIRIGNQEDIVDLFKANPQSDYIYKVDASKAFRPNADIRIERASYLLSLIFFTIISFFFYTTISNNFDNFYIFNGLLWLILFII